MKETIMLIIVGIVSIESITNFEPIIKYACEVSGTAISSIDYNREQAKLYGYNDVYNIEEDKRIEHEGLCSQYK